MNRDTQKNFLRINGAVSSYCATCREAYKKYIKETATAKAESEAYKDSAGVYAARESAAAETARLTIATAHEALVKAVQPEIDELEAAYREQLVSRPSPVFTDTLKMYRDYGLVPSRSETEQLLSMSNGSLLGIAALNKVLSDGGAKYTVSGPTSATYERDIATIRKLIAPDLIYSPNDIFGAGGVWKGQRRTVRKDVPFEYFEDGSVWDIVSLKISNGYFEAYSNDVKTMGGRWSASFRPTVEQFDQYEDKEVDGETVTAAEQFIDDLRSTANSSKIEDTKSDVDLGHQIGETNAKAAETYSEVMRIYGK